MLNRRNHSRKTVIDYKIDNLISVLIPRIDRTDIDASRLPVKIIRFNELENGHKFYELLSDFGILDVMQSENDLKPSNLPISCQDDKLNTNSSLHSAAFNNNNRTTATSKTCK